MLSEFGKFSRKLRIERNELLIDMAQKLDVKPSFLSAVEVGKKGIPNNWEEKIIEKYDLNEEQIRELKEAIDRSAKVLKVDLTDRDIRDKDLLFAFARKLDVLDTKDKESIFDILNRKNNKQ